MRPASCAPAGRSRWWRRRSAACCASSSWSRPACRSRKATSVVEFDPADQQYALEQAKSELAEAEQEIVKMKADAAVQAAQDEVALLTARFDVRRARARRGGQRVHRRRSTRRRTCCRSRRRGAGWRSSSEDVKSRAATNQASLAVVAGEAQQGAARDAARAAGHRQPRDQGAVRRRRLGQGKPRRVGRHDLLGHGAARVSRGRSDLAGPSGRPTSSSRAAWRCAPRSTRAIAPTWSTGRPRSSRSTRCRARRSTRRSARSSGLASRANFFESAGVDAACSTSRFQFDQAGLRG